MSPSKTEKDSSSKAHRKRKDRASEIANTFEWLITAFILAFVFRAFVMEAFRIPTGSMADTLRGAHFRLRCPQCGYRYNHGFTPQSYGLPQDTMPPGEVTLRRPTHCPSCGHYLRSGIQLPVANGDRLLVLKCIYQFVEPRRWDVIVFRNPRNPSENYIKRLIGLSGEQVEIIDGDVYIDGRISRKPPHVQDELWMTIYDNDYQPVNPNQHSFNGNKWRPPFNFADSNWEVDENDPTQFHLDCPANQSSTLIYGGPSANVLKATYAYNDVGRDSRMPECSDLQVRFYVQSATPDGHIGIVLSKYGVRYKARVDLKGEMAIAKLDGGNETVLIREPIELPTIGNYILTKFVNVDHQLIFQFGSKKLTYDLGRLPDSLSRSDANVPRIEIAGSGKLTLSHIAIFRDIHYTSVNFYGRKPGRATQGNPFVLRDNEFFVLGDNSPNSEDGRWWAQPDKATKGCLPPRAGIVPRDYLVGKALFVYWPSGFEFPWPESLKTSLLSTGTRNPIMRIVYGIVSLRWIPNVGQMRFVYGGSSSYLVNREAYLERE